MSSFCSWISGSGRTVPIRIEKEMPIMNANFIDGFSRKARLFFLVLGVLWACPLRPCQAKDKLDIVTTTTNLESIAKAVGGDHVNVSAISTGKEDPHSIAAKPSYMLKAKKADLWIRIGLELEIGYEGLILEGSRNPKIRVGSPGHLDASEGIAPLEVPTGKVSRTMGDVHPLGNPHHWLDPYNGRIIARNICRRLKQLDSEHAGDYDRNLAAFVLNVDNAMFGIRLVEAIGGEKLWKMQSDGTLDAFLKDQTLSLDGWLAKLKPFERAKIVTYHRSWPYFARRFHLDIVAELEPKPGIPPGPGHILEVINTMKSDKVGIILTEPFYNRADADAVAEKTGAKVVVAATSVNGQEGADSYTTMIDNIVTRLGSALSEVSK
jgi:ABC-type Zn uptake system ZnuABC Zn-binding protein ZnuA